MFNYAGINGIVSRGPMCFDCNHQGEQDQCGIVKLCALNEVRKFFSLVSN